MNDRLNELMKKVLQQADDSEVIDGTPDAKRDDPKTDAMRQMFEDAIASAAPKAGQVVTIKVTGGKAQVVETLSGKLQYRVVDSNGDKVFVNGALLDLAISEVA